MSRTLSGKHNFLQLNQRRDKFCWGCYLPGKRGTSRSLGGDFSLLEKSIRDKVYVLDEATILYPGHGPTTTVGEECHSNPFVRPQVIITRDSHS